MWKDLSLGLATTACLMVTRAALESFLNSPLPSSAPLRDRKQIPYVVAVSKFAHYRRSEPSYNDATSSHHFKGYFNVAAESLLGKFYPMVALDIMDLPRLTVGMRHDKDIWCDTYRGGINHYEEES